MMNDNNSYDKDDYESFDQNSQISANNLLGKKKDKVDIPFCGCLSIQYYQPYFDVDTTDVSIRLWNGIIFCKREQNFLLLIQDRPDLYGPFWISTTLVFILAVASHLNGWLDSWIKGNEWEYDFQSVLTASSVVYGFSLGAPAILWFIFKQYEPNLLLMSTICLYGYGIAIFLPSVLLCLVPSNLICWLSLLSASLASSLFLLRSLAPFVINQAKKQAAILLGFVGCLQLALALCIKLYFFNDK